MVSSKHESSLLVLCSAELTPPDALLPFISSSVVPRLHSHDPLLLKSSGLGKEEAALRLKLLFQRGIVAAAKVR